MNEQTIEIQTPFQQALSKITELEMDYKVKFQVFDILHDIYLKGYEEGKVDIKRIYGIKP